MAPHPDKALSPVRINALKTKGRYADGNGLYLEVSSSGAKHWMLRTVVYGRRRDIGLGSLKLVTLAEAREKARHYRKIAREGGDPIAAKRKAQTAIPTFAETAQRVHGEHAKAWRSKHEAQWINTLEQYAFPVIGTRRVDQVDTADILKILGPIWLKRPETARRVRQRLRTVFDWAKVAGFRTEGNPVEAVEKALPRQPERRGHFEAMPYNEMPNFIQTLRDADSTSVPVQLAFEFLILTATRTSEVLGARWNEMELGKSLWTIPKTRMKAGREHRIPLSSRAFEILQQAKQLAGDSELVFPGRRDGRPMSNMVFLMTLRRMGLKVTAHGFRSSFRDWAAERTDFPREVCEAALAHMVKDKTEAAYRRGDLFEKRRELMSRWDRYLTAEPAAVIPLRA